MLKALAVLVVAGLGFGLGTADPPPPGDLRARQESHTPAPADPATVAAAAADAQITAQVTTSGATVEGVPFTRSSPRPVPRVCWYGQGSTGQEYYEYWKPGSPPRKLVGSLENASSWMNGQHPGWDSHATDTAGHWYDPRCRVGAPTDVVIAYYAAHPPVYVEPGTAAPATDTGVPPQVLAQVGFEAMDLPAGTIDWNPKLKNDGAAVVGRDTWVWIEGATRTVTVTAAVPGLSAQVTATLEHVDLTAPGADKTKCPDTGTPWTAGAKKSTCTIDFWHSSANQPVKDGQKLPTATLTATATWTATWTSTLDPTVRALPTQQLTTTAEVPVAEIEAIVTHD